MMGPAPLVRPTVPTVLLLILVFLPLVTSLRCLSFAEQNDDDIDVTSKGCFHVHPLKGRPR